MHAKLLFFIIFLIGIQATLPSNTFALEVKATSETESEAEDIVGKFLKSVLSSITSSDFSVLESLQLHSLGISYSYTHSTYETYCQKIPTPPPNFLA